jgi:hypothetical protein
MCGLAAAPAERKREGGARKMKNPPADFSGRVWAVLGVSDRLRRNLSACIND